MQGIARLLQLRQRGTTVARELRDAVATFLTMAYAAAIAAQFIVEAQV